MMDNFIRKTMGVFPIVIYFLKRMNIFNRLEDIFPLHGNTKVAQSKVFISLIANISTKRTPLYSIP